MYSLEVCTTRVGLSRYVCRDSPPSTLDSLPGECIDYVFLLVLASTVARRAVLTKYIPTGSTLHIGRVSIVCMYERTCVMLTILNVWEFYVGTHRVAVHV